MQPNSNLVGARDRLLGLVHQHEVWRAECLNLVAAENAMSPVARSLLSSDLAQRYGDYSGRDLNARRYFGTRYVAELEMLVMQLAEKVFGARFVELRPISGHVAGNCVLMALCKPGDLVIELSRYDGGHRLATKLAASPIAPIAVDYFPFDTDAYNIDVDRTLDMVRERRPRMLLVGSSNFLFPAPVAELAAGLKEFPDTLLVYDASHVLGLIAGQRFQHPLREGAHLVLGGTQKSFPGPQGGVIYTDDASLIETVSSLVHPAMLSNHHLAHLPSLGIALLEMQTWGTDYADQVIENAQTLARTLNAEGVSVVGAKGGYTVSHTVVVNTSGLGHNETLGQRLESAGLIVTTMRLPQALGGEGIRLGTNEVTRRGAARAEMVQIGQLVADVLMNRQPTDAVARATRELARSLQSYLFTWPVGL